MTKKNKKTLEIFVNSHDLNISFVRYSSVNV